MHVCVCVHVCLAKTYYLPTGLVSKNSTGACSIDLNILLCKLRAAAKQSKKHRIALNVISKLDIPTSPPYIPIL